MSVLKTLTINGTTYNVTPIVPASSVTLLASAWTGEGDLHSQVVEIPGVTPRTKVDLQPTAEQLEEFYYKILAFSAENDEGVVTVYAIGDRPLGDHTIQITLTEVEGEGKIRGNTVGTPAPRSDWNQTDPRKADYIANKPDVVGQKTPNGGEIFNDYSGNSALSANAHAEGQETLAGIKGFNIAEVDADALTITVNDKDFENKASASYAVGDFLQFDASQHHYNKLKIVSLSTNDNGQSVIGVKNLTATDLDLTLDSDPNENYVWVVGKNYGEAFPMAYAPHAEGEGTIAMGRAAHAEGRQTQAIGGYAHAEGRKTVALYAAHAEGLQTNATGYYSHTEGHKTNATNDYSHAEGRETNATGTASHAEGMETAASGNHAHAEGNSTKAIGLDSHSEGRGTKAIGDHSHAEGLNVEALGIAAHAEGYMTTAKGNYSHAEGNSTVAYSDYAHAEGGGTTAGSSYTHAEGRETSALGSSSHSEGRGTKASGSNSHAEGYATVAQADNSHAGGLGTIADQKNQTVIGQYNDNTTATDALFVVGNGINNAHRSNAFTVNKDGTVTAGADPVNPMDLATKRHVADAVGVAEAIAKGKATGYVFDTADDLDAWLSDPANTANLVLGDNLYIRATDVPDYWWDGEQKQPLETQKVDLTEYVKNTDYATSNKAGLIKANSNQGFYIDATGALSVVQAQDGDFTTKTNKFRPVTANNLDLAVKTGVTTNTIELTDEEKGYACSWMGAMRAESWTVDVKSGEISEPHTCSGTVVAVFATILTSHGHKVSALWTPATSGMIDQFYSGEPNGPNTYYTIVDIDGADVAISAVHSTNTYYVTALIV